MIALAIVALGVLVVICVVVIERSSSFGTGGRDRGVRVGLHRARRTLDATLLKQDIRRDGRRFRRELRHDLEDIEDL